MPWRFSKDPTDTRLVAPVAGLEVEIGQPSSETAVDSKDPGASECNQKMNLWQFFRRLWTGEPRQKISPELHKQIDPPYGLGVQPDPWASLAHEVEFIGGPLCGTHLVHPAANYIQRCQEDPHGFYQFNGLAYHWVPSAKPNQIGPVSDERL